MFLNLETISVPVPFTDLTTAEQQLIERLDSCRRSTHQLIGEAKMSDRQTVVLLSYLITILLRPSQEQEEAPKTVLFLTRGEGRRRQLLKMAQEVHKFVGNALTAEERSRVFSLEGKSISDSKVVLKFYLGTSEDEKDHEETFQYCKTNGLLFKRIYFLRAQKYLQFRMRKREEAVWKKGFQFGCQSDGSVEMPAFLAKRADYLFLETNDLQGLLGELTTVEIPEVHLHRAFIEFRKLSKLYNYRLDERKGKNTKNPSRKDVQERQEEKGREQEAKEGTQMVDEGANGWNVADYDRKFNELYKQKKELLVTAKVGYIPTTAVAAEYEECYYLMNLQIIGYMLSFLVLEWRNNQFKESHDTLNSFLSYVYSQTFVPSNHLRRLRRILLAFIRKHPPRLDGEELSYVYIEQVLLFFQRAVIWNDIFCKVGPPGSSTAYPQAGDQINSDISATRFMVFRQKNNKDSNLKLLSFDQRILLQLLAEGGKSFAILQNLALSFEYYESVFRPDKMKELKLDYVCPKLVGEFSRHILNGFIVSSTPNEQDLHLWSQKQQGPAADLLQQRKVDKDHYSQIIRAYGVLVHDICELTPDGVVVYFPSRALLRECRAEWQSKENIYQKINQIKRIYQQEEWEEQNIYAVYDFKRRCQAGRGAVFFIAAESEFAKFQTFYGYYSKCVIFLGVPYHPYPLETEQKIKYLRVKEQHQFQQALRNVCRCLSNCINSTQDMKTVIFADNAYNRTDLQKKWFPFIQEGNLNTLQVLDWLLAINKNSTKAMAKQKEEEKRRKLQVMQRKREDRLDFIRRNSYNSIPQV